MANKPGDQGAPGGGASTFAAPNTAENDAEFDMCTIWPALHLSPRRVCPPLGADTTSLSLWEQALKADEEPQTGPVHSNQALQPMKVLPPTTAVGPSKGVSSEQSKAESHEDDSHVDHSAPV